MAHDTPIVRDDLLLIGDEPIVLGSAGWFAWLKSAERFRYLGAEGGFTARRERASSGRGGDYWRAYRRQGGKLAHAYLGKSGALTAERLRAADARLGAPGRHTAPTPPAPTPLLATKLAPPPLRTDRVPRPELVQRLAGGLLPITLVAAPAGFGKTTLLAEWFASPDFEVLGIEVGEPTQHSTLNTQKYHAAWLALDLDDNDPARFWSYLVAALRRLFPNIPEQGHAPQLLAATSGQTYLVNTIAAAPNRGMLVLDDYHLIDSPPIHAGIAFLLEHLPAQLRVVISTRAEPPLPLARWRARGQLAELRAGDLRFQPEQAGELLAAARPAGESLPAPTLATLYARAEGWPAGLQLAALALRHAADPRTLAASFGGSHNYLAGYLLAEVFERLPPATQRFLLHTAPLGRLCGPLCDAVRNESAGRSGESLGELERANLFLTRLDDAGEWYRFHHLFGEFLLARLRQTEPAAEPELRRRAARWLAQAGLHDEALGHAFACGDPVLAAHLLAEHAPTLLRRGEFTTLRQRLAQLPEALIWSQPRLALARIWDWLDMHQLGDVLPSLDRLDQLVAQPGPGAGAQLQAETLAVRAIVMAMRDQPDQALALAREVERMPLSNDLAGQAYVAFGLGAAHKMGLRFELAAEQFRRAAALAQASGNTYIAFSSLGNLADVQYEQAQLYAAEQSSRRALATVALAPGLEPPTAGWIHWSLGRIALQWGQLAQARDAAERCVALCAEWGNLGMHVRGYVLLASIARAAAEHDRAGVALAEADRLALQLSDPKILALVSRQRALQALAERNLPLARRLCEQPVAGGAGPASGLWAIVQARVLMAEGQPAQALERLRPSWQRYAGGELATLRLQLLVAEALARRACGQPEQAGDTLERALGLAQPGGFVQIFLDEGAPMLELLRRRAAHSAAPHYLGALLRAFGEPAGAPEAEPLTTRERQIVRALAAGLSNQAIAAELVIAESTLKRHLSNLYLKLDVHSRTQAIARAAELHLLER